MQDNVSHGTAGQDKSSQEQDFGMARHGKGKARHIEAGNLSIRILNFLVDNREIETGLLKLANWPFLVIKHELSVIKPGRVGFGLSRIGLVYDQEVEEVIDRTLLSSDTSVIR
ncbi:unnamed protein product [Bursaphelenchus okinawaensis]|uniref:Uncharacterized protein n=1 Tax=Bursaphelenchus okinawaensis TaxID=465554 RepID=A0A811K084_9BILA|nr:unnamed protein product [Bursaphelenchus okinawaensis]CAG9088903.1 unnamed protein product [Bursaphelenchus okinawaensis]